MKKCIYCKHVRFVSNGKQYSFAPENMDITIEHFQCSINGKIIRNINETCDY